MCLLEAVVSFVSKVRCLISFWHVPAPAGGDTRHEIGGVGVEGELGIEKAEKTPESRQQFVTVIVPVFRTRVPLVDEVAGRLSPPSASRWKGFPYTPCGGFRGSRWRGPAGMSYSCCSSAVCSRLTLSIPRSLSPAAASLNLSGLSPGSTAAGAARPFQPLASVKLASRPL